jgi:hypothetical protein
MEEVDKGEHRFYFLLCVTINVLFAVKDLALNTQVCKGWHKGHQVLKAVIYIIVFNIL